MMPIEWNTWRAIAQDAPKAGQLQTKGDEVVRNKRAWGSHKLSATALDDKRSLKDVRLNQDALGDVYASLKNEFGGPTADIVYGQIFDQKFTNGRPISSADILVAHALAKNVLAAQDHLIRNDHHYGAEIVLNAFSLAFDTTLIDDDGKITTEAVQDRIEYAHHLAKTMLTNTQITSHSEELLATAAALPPQERKDFIAALHAKVAENEEVEVTAPLAEDLSNAYAHRMDNERRDHQIELNQERRRILELMIPGQKALSDLDKIDKTVSHYAALTEGLDRTISEIAGIKQELDVVQGDLAQITADLPAQQARCKDIDVQIAKALQAQADLEKEKKTITDTELSPLESDLASHDLSAVMHKELLAANERALEAEGRTLSILTGEAVPAGENKVAAVKLQVEIAAKELQKNPKKQSLIDAKEAADNALKNAQAGLEEMRQNATKLAIGLEATVLENAKLREKYSGKAAAQIQGEINLVKAKLDDIEMRQTKLDGILETLNSDREVAYKTVKIAQEAIANQPAKITQLKDIISLKQLQADSVTQQIEALESLIDDASQEELKLQTLAYNLARNKASLLFTPIEDLIRLEQFLRVRLENKQSVPPALIPGYKAALLEVQDLRSHQLHKRFKDNVEKDTTLLNAANQRVRDGADSQAVNIDSKLERAPYFEYTRRFSHELYGGTSGKGHKYFHPQTLLGAALTSMRQTGMSAKDATTEYFKGSDANRTQMIALLEARKKAAANGVIPAFAFGSDEQELLDSFKLRYGNLYLLQHLKSKGGNLGSVIDSYKQNKGIVDGIQRNIIAARQDLEIEIENLDILKKQAAAGTVGNQIGAALANNLPTSVSTAIFGVVPALTPAAPLTDDQQIQLQTNLLNASGRLAHLESSLKEALHDGQIFSLLLRSAIEPSNQQFVENFYKATYEERHGAKPTDALVKDTMDEIIKTVPREVLDA